MFKNVLKLIFKNKKKKKKTPIFSFKIIIIAHVFLKNPKIIISHHPFCQWENTFLITWKFFAKLFTSVDGFFLLKRFISKPGFYQCYYSVLFFDGF